MVMVDVAKEVVLGENHVETGVGEGRVRVGRIEVDSASIGTVITRDCNPNWTRWDDGRTVMASVVVASWGKLTMVAKPPSD